MTKLDALAGSLFCQAAHMCMECMVYYKHGRELSWDNRFVLHFQTGLSCTVGSCFVVWVQTYDIWSQGRSAWLKEHVHSTLCYYRGQTQTLANCSQSILHSSAFMNVGAREVVAFDIVFGCRR